MACSALLWRLLTVPISVQDTSSYWHKTSFKLKFKSVAHHRLNTNMDLTHICQYMA